MKTVLIAGGTGLIGRKVQKLFLDKGHTVRILTRDPREENEFRWNPVRGEIDTSALKKVDTLLNLCGEGIADRRWTNKRKVQLHQSRIKTTEFLASLIVDLPALSCYVTASGINCYGYENSKRLYHETDPFGMDYLSQLVKEWENSADLFAPHCRVVKIRTAVVLDHEKGALSTMSRPVRWGLGSALGSGQQVIPWVHSADHAKAIYHLVDTEFEGEFHSVAGNDTNQVVLQNIASLLKRRLWKLNVPTFFLKILLGEMSVLVLNGVKASNAKLLNTGFEFQFKDLNTSLKNLLIDKPRRN
jgi:uncharacterized protein